MVADVWARTGKPWAEKFAADHVHPNDAGHGDWAAAFATAIGLTGPRDDQPRASW